MVEISQNFVAFSEYMDIKIKIFAVATAENSINAAKPEKIVDCTADFETELSFQ